MRNIRPTLVVAALCVHGLLALACTPTCDSWVASVALETTGHLLIEDPSIQDSGGPTPMLVMQTYYQDEPQDIARYYLDNVEGHGWAVAEYGYEVGWDASGKVVELLPEDLALTIGIEWDGSADTGAADFPLVEVQTYAQSVELWDGWVADLVWSGPYGACK